MLQTGRTALEGKAADLERDEQVQEIYLGGAHCPWRARCAVGMTPHAKSRRHYQAAERVPQSSRVAICAPSTSDLSFAHMIVG